MAGSTPQVARYNALGALSVHKSPVILSLYAAIFVPLTSSPVGFTHAEKGHKGVRPRYGADGELGDEPE
jgi:hypothetical protein